MLRLKSMRLGIRGCILRIDRCLEQFTIDVLATVSYLNITYTDLLGNVWSTYRVEHDATAPQCEIHAAVYMNGTDLVLSSTLASHFAQTIRTLFKMCIGFIRERNTLGVNQAVSGSPIPPSLSLSLWQSMIAHEPRPIVFDTGAPSIDFSNLSFISLDEEEAKRQGSFDVHCLDAVGDFCSIHLRQTTLSGVVLGRTSRTKAVSHSNRMLNNKRFGYGFSRKIESGTNTSSTTFSWMMSNLFWRFHENRNTGVVPLQNRTFLPMVCLKSRSFLFWRECINAHLEYRLP